MNVIGYVRISEPEDRKGQNPQRQNEVLVEWVVREQSAETPPRLVDVLTDDGKSATKTNPFERPVFVKACEKAKLLVAEGVPVAGILVEKVDRFTRQGNKKFGWAIEELQRRYGLRLFVANEPLARQLGEDDALEITQAVDAQVARRWAREHGKSVRSGMKSTGKMGGRPPKSLTPAELELARRLQAEGKGSRRIAHAISEQRGAFRVADKKAQGRLKVSHQLVFEYLTGARK